MRHPSRPIYDFKSPPAISPTPDATGWLVTARSVPLAERPAAVLIDGLSLFIPFAVLFFDCHFQP